MSVQKFLENFGQRRQQSNGSIILNDLRTFFEGFTLVVFQAAGNSSEAERSNKRLPPKFQSTIRQIDKVLGFYSN